MKTNRIIAVTEDEAYEFEFMGKLDESVWKKAVEKEIGKEVVRLYDRNKYHICQYCGNIVLGTDDNVLCDECIMSFGHVFYSEL